MIDKSKNIITFTVQFFTKTGNGTALTVFFWMALFPMYEKASEVLIIFETCWHSYV